MEVLPFPDYDMYHRAQARTVQRRSPGPFFAEHEIDAICEWLKKHEIKPVRGVCHGARCGTEVAAFKERMPDLDIIGTDLFPEQTKVRDKERVKDVKVIKWDFMKPHRRWTNHFDLIYSNSMDHAFDPYRCAEVWLSQLRRKGWLFVQWCFADRYASGGDCVGATLDEYIQVFMRYGTVKDVLVCLGGKGRRATDTFVVVARRRLTADKDPNWPGL